MVIAAVQSEPSPCKWESSLEFPAANTPCGRYTRTFFEGSGDYGNYLDEVWTLDNRAGGITVADLNDNTGAQRLFYHQNTLFHIYGITDEIGSLIEAYEYNAYGKQTVITDGNDGDTIVNFGANDVRTVGGNSTVNNPYMYTGQRLDPEVSLTYYKNRYFTTDLGRFITRDPIKYADGINLYAYLKGKVTRYVDAFGFGQTVVVGAIKYPDPSKAPPGEDRSYDFKFLKRKANKEPNFVGSTSAQEFFDGLSKIYEDCIKKGKKPEDCCIEKLVRDGHSSAGLGGQQGFDNLTGQQMKYLQSIMCKNAVVHEAGCFAFNYTLVKSYLVHLKLAELLIDSGGTYEGRRGIVEGEYPGDKPQGDGPQPVQSVEVRKGDDVYLIQDKFDEIYKANKANNRPAARGDPGYVPDE